jgi:hypothetical protein
MAMLSIGRSTPHLASSNQFISSSEFYKGNKKVRILFNEKFCNLSQSNTKEDPFGKTWKDDEWI